jgi:hypothetical protein
MRFFKVCRKNRVGQNFFIARAGMYFVLLRIDLFKIIQQNIDIRQQFGKNTLGQLSASVQRCLYAPASQFFKEPQAEILLQSGLPPGQGDTAAGLFKIDTVFNDFASKIRNTPFFTQKFHGGGWAFLRA